MPCFGASRSWTETSTKYQPKETFCPFTVAVGCCDNEDTQWKAHCPRAEVDGPLGLEGD